MDLQSKASKLSDEDFDNLMTEIHSKDSQGNSNNSLPISLKSITLKCPLVDRIGGYLKSYDIWLNSNKQQNMKILMEIDLPLMMNDYSNLEKERCPDCDSSTHSAEDVYAHIVTNIFDGKPCILGKCTALQRNTRDRMTDTDNIYSKLTDGGRLEVIAKVQILDAIHTAIFHAFDTGYKLTEEDEIAMNVNNNYGDDEDNDNVDYFDDSSVLMRRLVDARINEFTDMRSDVNKNETTQQALQHSKFVTHIASNDGNTNNNNNVDDDSKSGDCEDEYSNDNESGSAMKNKKMICYSSGHMFFYTLRAKNGVNISHPVVNSNGLFSDFYVEKRFPCLKDEVLKNAIKCIPMNAWKETLAKALIFLSTSRVKRITKLDIVYLSFDFNGYFTDVDEPAVEHILCILFYCNFTELSYEFSRTFRLLDANEDRDVLKARHSNFANWGDLLQQTVQFFSTLFPDSSIKIFYHGVSQEMLFDGAYARFNSPTSTSTNFLIATNFAKGGIILELFNDGYRSRRFFSCKFFSDFKNEEECLFFNTFMQVKFYSIRHLGLRENYQSFIKTIGIFNCLVNGAKCPYKIVNKFKNILAVLINKQLEEELMPVPDIKYTTMKIPVYIRKLFNHTCHSLDIVCFVGIRLVSAGAHRYKSLMPLICNLRDDSSGDSSGYPIESFKYEIWLGLFHTNVTLILFWYCALTKQLMEDIINKIILNPHMVKLKSIEIVNVDNYKRYGNLTVDEVFNLYSGKCTQLGWNLQKTVAAPHIAHDFSFGIVKHDT